MSPLILAAAFAAAVVGIELFVWGVVSLVNLFRAVAS